MSYIESEQVVGIGPLVNKNELAGGGGETITSPTIVGGTTSGMTQTGGTIATIQAAITALQAAVDAIEADFPIDLNNNVTGNLQTANAPLGSMIRLTPASITAAQVGNGTTAINVEVPAGFIAAGVKVKTSLVFSGAGLGSATLDVGISGTADMYIATYDLTAAVSATNQAVNTGANGASIWSQTTTDAYNIVFTFTTDADPTAGSVTYWIYGIQN